LGAFSGWATTSGDDNTFVGYEAGYSNETGDKNTFIGTCSGLDNTTGHNNSFLGYMTGHDNTTGSGNSFIGYNTGFSNYSGYDNTFIGFGAGYNNVDGNYNTFIGVNAGYNNTTPNLSDDSGDYNTFIGTDAGFNNTTGKKNVFIGYKAGFNETTNSNRLYIDNCAAGDPCTNPFIFGDFSQRYLLIHGMITFSSDERLKKNIEPLKSSLDKVMKLNGVSYEWEAEEHRGNNRDIGLIAQDVEKVLPELVVTDDRGYKALSYDKIVPVLVEAIKEQQKFVDEQRITIAGQKQALAAQQAVNKEFAEQLGSMKAELNRLKSKDMSAQK
jgi:hypothetical protein